jgi:hypothetical protein
MKKPKPASGEKSITRRADPYLPVEETLAAARVLPCYLNPGEYDS